MVVRRLILVALLALVFAGLGAAAAASPVAAARRGSPPFFFIPFFPFF